MLIQFYMDYPKVRNIDVFPLEVGRQRMVGLRDPSNLTDEVLVVPHSTIFLLRFFDGRHSLLDIQAEYMRQYGEILFTDSLQKLIEELDSHLFLESDRFRECQEKMVQEFKSSRVRKACHVEKGYPSDPEKLKEMLEGFFISPDGPGLPGKRPQLLTRQDPAFFAVPCIIPLSGAPRNKQFQSTI